DSGSSPEKRGARRGSSFATASTHASCQCVAITPPPVTRQPGPKGAGGAMTPRPHQCAISLTSRDESRRGLSGPRPRSEARPGIVPRNGVPDGRQLRDSIYARVLPVRCHHAATSDTPTRSQGRGRSDDTAPASVRHRFEERRGGASWTERTETKERSSTRDRSPKGGARRAAGS